MLLKRTNEIMVYTQEKNTEKILDYTYPKLFTIISRSQMTEALNGMYDTDGFTTVLDSLFIIKLHPVFTVESKEYCRIVHNMIMRMNFKETIDTSGEESEADRMVDLMEVNYGKGNVRFDTKNNALIIKIKPEMIAVKEDNTWYFATYNRENPAMLDLLFSKAVQKKFEEFH